MSCDFRYEKGALKGLNYAICGLGNSLYEENFNKCAIELDKAFSEMHANRVAPLYCCDENTIKSKHGSLEADVTYWQNNFFEKLKFHLKPSTATTTTTTSGCCKQGDENNNSTCCQKKEDNNENEEEVYEDTTSEGEDDEDGNYMSDMDEDLDEDGSVKKQPNGLVDMEDLGKVVNGIKKKRDAAKNGAEPKEMITPLLRKSLEKQGYKLIGSHSGVKLCRWTKSMLRGK